MHNSVNGRKQLPCSKKAIGSILRSLLDVRNDSAFDFLHSDERYRSIIGRVGLPQAY